MAKIATDRTTKTNGSSTRATAENRNLATHQGAEIEKLAYQFFVERGYQHGHDREDWLRAEAIVKKRRF